MNIAAFWKDVLSQNRSTLASYFCEDAVIRWHCSNEQFTVSEYIRANCDYPGNWDGEIERIETVNDLIITAVRVYPADRSVSFHVVSFLLLRDGLIQTMDEYWADDGDAAQWRQDTKIGKPICKTEI